MSLMDVVNKILRINGHEKRMSPKNVIFITGCDSGLGYTLALFCHSLNMTVAAACHNSNSQGARSLLENSKTNNSDQRMHIIELDLRHQQTITKAREELEKILAQSDEYEFTALVNNAGVMCFGEFEWQTSEQCAKIIDVNIMGTWRITRELLPLMRKYQSRIINITSHCALNSLPAVAPYAASKAALRYWNDALRIEMAQYGVQVVNFIPGSFVMQSNIAARQKQDAHDQLAELNPEQRTFYGAYFERFHNFLGVVSGFKEVQSLSDDELLKKFLHALTHTHPYAVYIHEPWRYKVYRLLFSISPTPISDWLKVKFCAMPTYAEMTPNKINGCLSKNK